MGVDVRLRGHGLSACHHDAVLRYDCAVTVLCCTVRGCCSPPPPSSQHVVTLNVGGGGRMMLPLLLATPSPSFLLTHPTRAYGIVVTDNNGGEERGGNILGGPCRVGGAPQPCPILLNLPCLLILTQINQSPTAFHGAKKEQKKKEKLKIGILRTREASLNYD